MKPKPPRYTAPSALTSQRSWGDAVVRFAFPSARRQRALVPGAELVLDLEHDRAVGRVRARRQRLAHVHEPRPEAVADAELHAPRVREQLKERMVDRQEVGVDRRRPVDVEEIPPELGSRASVECDRLDDLELRLRRSRLPLRLVPVDRVPLRPPVALEDDEALRAALAPARLLEEDPKLPPVARPVRASRASCDAPCPTRGGRAGAPRPRRRSEACPRARTGRRTSSTPWGR